MTTQVPLYVHTLPVRNGGIGQRLTPPPKGSSRQRGFKPPREAGHKDVAQGTGVLLLQRVALLLSYPHRRCMLLTEKTFCATASVEYDVVVQPHCKPLLEHVVARLQHSLPDGHVSAALLRVCRRLPRIQAIAGPTSRA